MTPEEKAVIKAAQAWAKLPRRYPYGNDAPLMNAVAALKVSRQPLHTVAAIPCGAPSSTGAMLCELPAGHDPDDSLNWTVFAHRRDGRQAEYAYRVHEGRASNGSARTWDTWVERWKP